MFIILLDSALIFNGENVLDQNVLSPKVYQ